VAIAVDRAHVVAIVVERANEVAMIIDDVHKISLDYGMEVSLHVAHDYVVYVVVFIETYGYCASII
jgi:hypothetical protein